MIADKPIMALVLCLLLAGSAMLSCSPRALREGRDVVAQADSLRAEGEMYSDSIPLAQAYETLGQWQWFYADEYAHACYHYGRLLREKDHPAEAMQCFINATHSRTRDYHILGRVYSNMGSICHLANEFPMAYDMFAKAADCFLEYGDTLLYYHALNEMAFELAEQGKKEETLCLIHDITEACSDPNLQKLTNMAAAILYDHIGQYDSVLPFSNQSQVWQYASFMILKARAFEHTGEIDSSLYYAKEVLDMPASTYQDKYNALYIVLNYDSTLRNEELIALSAQRSDIETDVLIPLHNQWAVAVQLLQEDLNRNPDWRWIYSIIVTIGIIGIIISIYIRIKSRKHALLTQKLEDLNYATLTAEEKHNELTELYQSDRQRMLKTIEHKCEFFRKSEYLSKELAWKNFDVMCLVIDQQFYMFASHLRQKQILNETEVRLCILVLLDLNRTQIAETLPYSKNSVGKLKDHTAKLLGTTGKNLRHFLLKLVLTGSA